MHAAIHPQLAAALELRELHKGPLLVAEDARHSGVNILTVEDGRAMWLIVAPGHPLYPALKELVRLDG